MKKILKKLGYVPESSLNNMIAMNVQLGIELEAIKLSKNALQTSNNVMRRKLNALQKHVKSKKKPSLQHTVKK